MFVNVSVPANVAKVPVVGNVTLVAAVVVRVRAKAPAVVNEDAVESAPPKVRFPFKLTTQLPSFTLMPRVLVFVRFARFVIAK